ncbi:Protein CBG15142 [Caenorhabditis briggsae]|uniref:Protein CBG15142 n=1 Tax=Caenorhabditis briggsae TaxID=6238 RepID=A8XLU8_CAEBR|nr:Protein CBG15142 [Caenorhabditis briggsae]CAP33602.2 Protein CBG15142 [Caenorhabditis briggsae]
MRIPQLPLRYSKRWSSREYRLAGNERSVSVDFNGKNSLELKTGHMARFASAAVVASSGDNSVMATVVQRKQKQGDGNGVPLQVEYRPSASAVGRIPTNFLRRELSQSDNEILISRAIDRSIRPLMPANSYETQVICKPLALDENADQIMLGINAASSALHISSAPFNGPLAAIRVSMDPRGKIFHVNPGQEELKASSMNMIVAMRRNQKTVMIELDGEETRGEQLEEALDVAFQNVERLHVAMDELGGIEKDELPEKTTTMEILEILEALARERIYYVMTDSTHDKISRDEEIKAIMEDVIGTEALQPFPPADIYQCWSFLVKKVLRETTLSTGIRCDGRRPTDFRPIRIQVDMYKKLHGCSMFQRGQTQVMSTVTFDSPTAAFHPDSVAQLLGSQRKKSFMLHYEFPSFATNDIGVSASRSLNRREIGHGALAEKALKPLFPTGFPYAVRLACQVLESNGSSSMASVCGGSLALYDAGVPMKNAAAGVAIGLISDEKEPETNYKVLTDILGIEDYAGDMDFKIAGTKNGFTAAQLDVKNDGLTRQQLRESLDAARAGIDHVLGKMAIIRDRPREQPKSTVPIIESMRIEPHKRVTLFRNNGYNCKLIEAETGVKISVEDESNISLLAPSQEKLQKALSMMNGVLESNTTLDFAFGSIIQAEIVELNSTEISELLIPILPEKLGVWNSEVPRLLKIQIFRRWAIWVSKCWESSGEHNRKYENNEFPDNGPWCVRHTTRKLPTSPYQQQPSKSSSIRHPDVLGLKVGDKMACTWFGRDEHTGNIRLSRKTLAGASHPATQQKK